MHASEYRVMRQCEDRHWWYVGLHELVTRTLRTHRCGQSGRILDAGCGTGGWLASCRDVFPASIGLEYSPCAFQELESRGLGNLVRGDIRRIPFADRHFDGVTSCDVLCSLVGDDVETGFDELVRVVRPGGVLLLNLPAFRWLYSGHDAHVGNTIRFTRNEVTAGLRRRGMRIEYAGYRMSFLFPIAVTLRLFRRLIRQPENATASDVRMPHPLVNGTLVNILRFENALIRRGWRMPFGLSVFVLAIKPPGISNA